MKKREEQKKAGACLILRGNYLSTMAIPLVISVSACGVSIPTSLDGLSSSSSVQSLAASAVGGSKTDSIAGVETEMPKVLAKLASGSDVDVDDIMEDDLDGRNEILARLERGRIGLIVGELDTSKEEFEKVAAKIREIEDRAKVSASDTGSHALALVSNDTMIPYEPSGFERVFAYQFQALNYLLEGEVDEAAVEVRRASGEQERALKAHQDEVDKAQADAKEKGFSVSKIAGALDSSLGDTLAVAGSVKNSFQNAYTFYMSGVIREALGETNDAYIDYKKALEIAPTNTFVQRDVLRLAKTLGMKQDLSSLGKKYPAALKASSAKADGVEVVVLFEDGEAVSKQPLKFDLPIPIPSAPGMTSVAIPTLHAKPSVPTAMTISASSGGELAQTEPICNVDALVVKAYQEAMPAMVTRQIVRAIIKGAASSLASKHAHGSVGLGVGMINSATEIADTRSWHSLPQNAQVARVHAAPGSTLALKFGPSTVESIELPDSADKRVVVHATRVGSKVYVRSVNL